jgi:hypothetical protein
MPVKTYSPGDVALSIGGNIITGYADGTFITVERETDAMTKVVGSDGEVSRTRSANYSGMLTLTLKQTSDGNRILGAYLLDDESDGSGVFDVLLADNLDNKIFSSEGWCRKGPNEEFSNEETNREWVIDLARIRQEWPAA